MDKDIKPKSTQSVAELEVGKPMRFGANRAVNFKIVTAGGSVIEGVIPANEYLNVVSGGDIQSYDILIFDQVKGPTDSID
jgi:hypothetical protein